MQPSCALFVIPLLVVLASALPPQPKAGRALETTVSVGDSVNIALGEYFESPTGIPFYVELDWLAPLHSGSGLAVDRDGYLVGTVNDADAAVSPFTLALIVTDDNREGSEAGFTVIVGSSDPVRGPVAGPSPTAQPPTTAPPTQAPNRAPQRTSTSMQQTVSEGQSVYISLLDYFSDPDGNSMSVSSANGFPSGSGLYLSGDHVQGSPSSADVLRSPFSVAVTVQDQSGLSAQGQLTLTVVASNNPPVATTSVISQSFSEGDNLYISLGQYFTDADGDSLDIGFARNTPLPSGSGLFLSGNVLQGSAAATDVAASPMSLTLEAQDGKGGAATATLQLTVQGGNKPPIIIGGTRSATVKQGEQVSIDLQQYFSDPEGNGITIQPDSSKSVPYGSGLYVTGYSGKLEGQPTDVDAKASPVTIGLIATDDQGASVEADFVLTITPAAPAAPPANSGPSGNSGPSPTPSRPTRRPSNRPTLRPTRPTRQPTQPAGSATHNPTAQPTSWPTQAPTQRPTKVPTGVPTTHPTHGNRAPSVVEEKARSMRGRILVREGRPLDIDLDGFFQDVDGDQFTVGPDPDFPVDPSSGLFVEQHHIRGRPTKEDALNSPVVVHMLVEDQHGAQLKVEFALTIVPAPPTPNPTPYPSVFTPTPQPSAPPTPLPTLPTPSPTPVPTIGAIAPKPVGSTATTTTTSKAASTFIVDPSKMQQTVPYGEYAMVDLAGLFELEGELTTIYTRSLPQGSGLRVEAEFGILEGRANAHDLANSPMHIVINAYNRKHGMRHADLYLTVAEPSQAQQAAARQAQRAMAMFGPDGNSPGWPSPPKPAAATPSGRAAPATQTRAMAVPLPVGPPPPPDALPAVVEADGTDAWSKDWGRYEDRDHAQSDTWAPAFNNLVADDRSNGVWWQQQATRKPFPTPEPTAAPTAAPTAPLIPNSQFLRCILECTEERSQGACLPHKYHQWPQACTKLAMSHCREDCGGNSLSP